MQEEQSSWRLARLMRRTSRALYLRAQDTQKRALERAKERWLSTRTILLIIWAI